MKISRNTWESWLKEEIGSTSWRLNWKKGRHAFLKSFQTRGPEIPVNSVPHYENSALSEWGLGTSSEPLHAHLRERGGSHWCLEPVAPGFPSENESVCGFERWKFLGLSSLWVGFIRASPKSKVFKRDSDGWAFLQKSVMRITVKDDSSCFCPFPFTLFLYCAQCHCRAFSLLFESVQFPLHRETGFLCSHKPSVLIQPLEIIPNSNFFKF